jgi:hypothetical protein
MLSNILQLLWQQFGMRRIFEPFEQAVSASSNHAADYFNLNPSSHLENGTIYAYKFPAVC